MSNGRRKRLGGLASRDTMVAVPMNTILESKRLADGMVGTICESGQPASRGHQTGHRRAVLRIGGRHIPTGQAELSSETR